MAEDYKRNPNTKCLECGKEVYRRPAQISAGKVFCSMTCYGLSCRKEIPCVVCGKLILSGTNRKTCSRICSNKNRVGVQYKISSPHDKVKSQKALKIRLLEKRGKICERCGYARYEILQVHHRDRNRRNNDLENLELICPNCHYEEHYVSRLN